MKKLTSILLVTAMLIGIMPISSIVFAAKPDIDIYEAFENYSGGTELDNWRIVMDGSGNNVRSTSDNGNKSLALHANGEAQIRFGKIFDEGKMHISFDVKKSAGDTHEFSVYLQGLRPEMSDQYDYTAVETDEQNWQGRNIILKTAAGENLPQTYADAWAASGAVDGSETSNKSYTWTNWNRVDIFIDQQPTGTPSPYAVYINGDKISTDETALSTTNATGVHTALGVGFKVGWLADSYAKCVMIDNVKVEQYSNVAPQPETMFVMGDNVAGIEKEVSVKFTEGLCKDPQTSDLVIKDESDSIVDSSKYSIEDASCTGFTLKTNDMVGGKYTMEFGEALTGCGSGVQPESAVFYVTDLTSTVDDTYYYYMNEDFNTYTGNTTGIYEAEGTNYDYTNTVYGDVPAGWVDAGVVGDSVTEKDSVNRFWSDRTYMANATKERFVQPEKRSDGDYAVKISTPVGSASGNDWNECIKYYFPTGVASGDFTLEFDVNHTNGGWSIIYSDLVNWDSAFEVRDGYYYDNSKASNAQTVVDQKHMGTYLLGMTRNGTNLMLNNSIDKYGLGLDSNIEVATNTWTNVKVDFNLNTGKYLVTVTPEGGTASTYTWTDSARGRFEKGVKGIGLRREEGGTVFFDNVKVYKKNSYYINDDFNDYVADVGKKSVNGSEYDASYMPSGWWKNNTQAVLQSTLDNVRNWNLKPYGIKEADGYGENNKAIEIVSAVGGDVLDNNVFFKAFPRAMGSGTPFEISFDLKVANGAGWKLLLPNQSHLEYLYGFNNNETTLADGTTKVWKTPGNWGNVQSKCIVLEKPIGSTATIRGNQWGLFFDYTASQPQLTDISTTEGTWYTYTLTVKPQSDGKANVTVNVTNAENSDDETTGGTGSFVINPYHSNTDWYQWPAAGLGFAKVGNGNLYIDNVKVYETGAEDENGVVGESTVVPKENITDIRVEYSNGTTKSLTANIVGQTVEPSVKRIAVEFSSPISILESEKVLQPLDIVKTAKKAVEKTPSLVTKEGDTVTSTLNTVINTGSTMNENASAFKDGTYLEQYKDCISRFKVYDVLEDVIQFKRLGNQAEAGDVKFSRYLSADRKTCYFEFDQLLTEDVDYVLTVDRNIPFSSSIYASLDESAIVKFGVKNTTVPGAYITEASLERQAGAVTAPIKSVADLRSQIENDKNIYMVVDGYNTDTSAVEMFAIMAQYEKDEVTGATVLVDCKYVPMSIDGKTTLNEPKKTELTDLTVEDDTNLVKCFVWKKTNNEPLSEMSVFE